MLKSIHGITKEPFCLTDPVLLPQQQEVANMLIIHASSGGGFSVIVADPGLGKSILREHLERLGEQRDVTVASCSRTLHTYGNVLKQLADSLNVDVAASKLETQLIHRAFEHAKERHTLYVIIDEAHLLEISVLRKLRLLFDRFPKRHNLVLLGQPVLLHNLCLSVNQDIKSRITYSATLYPLNDEALTQYIHDQLNQVNLGLNVFDEAAVDLIVRSANGNLRLCRNLCHGSLLQAGKDTRKTVGTPDVNNVLVQPHWRSHDELITGQARP